MRNTTVILITFAIIATIFASKSDEVTEITSVQDDQTHECPENQEWSDCASTCEPHCNKFEGKKCGHVMTMQCVFQCVCKTGYIRITEKECIREDSPQCGGKYDPSEAFRKHKYSEVLEASEDPVV